MGVFLGVLLCVRGVRRDIRETGQATAEGGGSMLWTVQDLNARKHNSVTGWALRRQLKSPS